MESFRPFEGSPNEKALKKYFLIIFTFLFTVLFDLFDPLMLVIPRHETLMDFWMKNSFDWRNIFLYLIYYFMFFIVSALFLGGFLKLITFIKNKAPSSKR
jgi:ABC-type multidrug transport system fused ATPase/permease subunit